MVEREKKSFLFGGDGGGIVVLRIMLIDIWKGDIDTTFM